MINHSVRKDDINLLVKQRRYFCWAQFRARTISNCERVAHLLQRIPTGTVTLSSGDERLDVTNDEGEWLSAEAILTANAMRVTDLTERVPGQRVAGAPLHDLRDRPRTPISAVCAAKWTAILERLGDASELFPHSVRSRSPVSAF